MEATSRNKVLLAALIVAVLLAVACLVGVVDLTEAHEAAVMVAVDRNDVEGARREVLLLRDRFGYDRERFRAWGAEDVLVNHPDLLALLPAP